MPEGCVVTFDNLHTVRRNAFRQRITTLPPATMDAACRVLARSLGCI
jgi:mRNA-degrading endonuclease toxin of MazEF toxin-antitoxin module